MKAYILQFSQREFERNTVKGFLKVHEKLFRFCIHSFTIWVSVDIFVAAGASQLPAMICKSVVFI